VRKYFTVIFHAWPTLMRVLNKNYGLLTHSLHTDQEELHEKIVENELSEISGSKNTTSEFKWGDIIDPTLTMDLTTMNPPALYGSAKSNELEETSPKEAESLPSNMDSGPERTKATETTSVAVLAGTAKEAESEVGAIDMEVQRTKNNATSEAMNETDTASLPVDVDSEIGTGGENGGETNDDLPQSSPPTPKVTAAASSTTETSSPPTMVSPAKNISATDPSSPPTMAYIESVDESLDPVANEETAENEGFEDGEAIPSGVEDGGNVEDESSSTTKTDDMYREEEEVKKVGGWLTVTSIILMIYTAYQMSENPDGICAR
jgi:hypothetical protein